MSLRRAEYGWQGPHYHFWEPPAPDYARDLNKNLPSPRTIPESHVGAWVPMLFPGIGIGAGEDSWNLFIITPLSPNLTRVENRTKLAKCLWLGVSETTMAQLEFLEGFWWSQVFRRQCNR